MRAAALCPSSKYGVAVAIQTKIVSATVLHRRCPERVERRIRSNAPAPGRPQTADPAGGQGGFRLGGNSGRGRMTAATLASDAGCPRGVTCGAGVISQAIGALLGLGVESLKGVVQCTGSGISFY
jgi:hypothetical protein